jgi:hypothetical protein
MFHRSLAIPGLLLAAAAAGNAGIVSYSINGGAFVNFAGGGTFNTGGNTNCGSFLNPNTGGICNETSGFGVANAAGSGVNIAGAINFTTTENLGPGFTTSAFEQATMTVDNTGAVPGNETVVVAFVSDEFDPSLAGSAGVGIFGAFLNDGLGNAPFVTANATGEMDYYVNGGVWGGIPGPGSFSLVTPTVGTGGLPTPFWTLTSIPGPIVGVQELVGFVAVNVMPFSEVSFPVDIEDDDTAALNADAPEPGSYLLLGVGLVGLGIFRRKRRPAR